MPRSVALVLLAGLLAFASPARADDVKAAIEAANAKREADYAAGDVKAIAEAYSEDGVMLPPDATWSKAARPSRSPGRAGSTRD
jgi:hypothetical protein